MAILSATNKAALKRKLAGVSKSWTALGSVLLTVGYELAYVAEPLLPGVQSMLSHNQYVALSSLIIVLLRTRSL